MSLRERLARIKGKVKEIFFGSRDTSPSSSASNLLSSFHYWSSSGSAGVFPPLISAINELNECMSIREGREGYDKLLEETDGLMEQLQERVKNQKSIKMTPKVEWICGELELEVKNLKAKLQGTVGQWFEAADTSGAIKQCHNRIQELLEGLNPPDNSTPETDERPSKTGLAGKLINLLHPTVNETAKASLMLQSEISGMREYIDVYQRESKDRKDYGQLWEKANKLLQKIRSYKTSRGAMEMTPSVGRICWQVDELESEAEKLKAKLKALRLEEWHRAADASSEISECLDHVHQLLEGLTLKATANILKTLKMQDEIIDKQDMERRLENMSPILSAAYNSGASDGIRRRGCAQGTRQQQIQSLLEWARAPQGGKVYWINGLAGTGKTTIAYSICTELDGTSMAGDSTKQHIRTLGASFFCSQAIPECRQVKNIIPTIAYQLSQYSAPFRYALYRFLKSDPDVSTRALKTQYDTLIVEPLKMAQCSLPIDFIVVIDALDECDDVDSLGEILDLLLSTPMTLPIKFLISSLPKPEIAQRMEGRLYEHANTLALQNIDTYSVKSDIEVFMRRELEDIPLTNNQWSGLLERCGVIFIYASTICRLIRKEHALKPLDEVVNSIKYSSPVVIEHNAVDGMYTIILEAALGNSNIIQMNRKRIKKILEIVAYNQGKTTLFSIADLLGAMSTSEVGQLMDPLRSVLNVTEASGRVTILHASFRDFLISSERSGKFCCIGAIQHAALAHTHLQTIEAVESNFNICGLPSSHLCDEEVESLEKRISRIISPELISACRHWSNHLYFAEYQNKLVAAVRNFLSKRLLIWMEILNLSKNMCFGRGIIQEVEMWCNENPVPKKLAQLARDAGEFVSAYAAYPISQSTPHIYVSLLRSWPQSRPVSLRYSGTGVSHKTAKATVQPRLGPLYTWRISTNSVYSISISANGTRIAAATKDAIYLLDSSTGDEIAHIEEQIGLGHRVSISPDGTKIVVSNTTFDLLLWDTANQESIVNLPIGNIWAAALVVFSPDGTSVAFTSLDRGVCIYGLKHRKLILCPLQGHTEDVSSIVFSPDGLYLALGLGDGSLLLWHIQSNRITGAPLEGHTGTIVSLSYSSDGSRLISTSTDGSMLVWDLQTRRIVLQPLMPHSNLIFSASFSPDGTLIATGSGDKTIQVYNAQTGQSVLAQLEGHTGAVNSVMFSPDNAQLFSCSSDGTICQWDVLGLASSSRSRPTLTNEVCSVRYFHSGSYIVSGLADGTMYIWNVQTGKRVLGPLKGHAGCITAVDISPDDTTIASSSNDKTVRVWDAQGGKDLHGAIMQHTDIVNCVRFSPDGSLIVSGSNDFTVQIWDVKSGQPVISPLEGHSGAVLSVVFSPNGSQIASGGRDGKIHLWDTNTGRLMIDSLRSHDKSVTSVEFSSDGSRILSACQDGSIQIWEADTHRTIFDCGGRPGNWPTSAIFSRNDRIVASYSGDRAIRLWDAQSGKPISSPLIGHTNWVRSIQFSPDGSRVVSCSDDCTIRFWDVSSRIAKEDEAHVDIPTTGGSSDPWYLENDGWIIGRQKERLLWLLPELRTCLLRHPNDLIISDRRSFQMNFDGENLGERWVDCYSPK
ncbi:unnamed protein product [Rhizoctonia solani]|uniref:Nephrocystin 3-like N-terminal domain-containing protein n=1 Tax=Rhizoctonia solani TaxID=456999 RepID=A0A8H3A5Q4_9AGAM|nr:unnamed protein product [Rhizoctonia solani]